MLNLRNKIKLLPTISRIFFQCSIGGHNQTILFDTGSPNTVITLELAGKLKLISKSSSMVKVHIANKSIDVVSTTLPDIKLGSLELKDVRVYAGLDKSWGSTIILGLNVLNHLIYTVDRTKGSGFINIRLGNKSKNNFNRLISADGKYYITDYP